MEADKEEELAVFISKNLILWNIKSRQTNRPTDKKNKLWEDQADIMGIPSEHLQSWFHSVRDQHTRLERRKSDDSLPNLTERSGESIKMFVFRKAFIRHVCYPVSISNVLILLLIPLSFPN